MLTLSVEFNTEQLLAAKGAFVSQFQHCIKSQEWMLEELDQCSFKVIEWDGRCVIFNSHHASLIPLRSPAAIVDQEDCVMTVLAGQPQSADWDHTHAHVHALLEQAVHKVHTPHKGSVLELLPYYV